jgi:hypothetical protein
MEDQLQSQNKLQKKRNQYLDENRRKKREDMFAKKRGRFSSVLDNAQLEAWQIRNYSLKDLLDLLNAINSNEVLQQHFGTIGIRLLSQNDDPPIQEIIDANGIPRLIGFTERYGDPQLQYEAAWALTNLASGTTLQTQSIIDNGGITAFVRLLKHENIKVAEQAIWALGNIGGDNTDFRDQILKANALPPLVDIINKSDDVAVIKNGTWALSNLVRGNPLPKFELVKETIPTFSRVIQETNDIETLVDAAWALSYLSDGKNRVSLVLATGICPELSAHITMNQRLAALVPLLRILGNLLQGTEVEAREVLEVPDIVDKLVELATNHQKRVVIRESCWCLSNIADGNSEPIQMVMKNSDQIRSLMELAQRTEPEVRKEVLWIFSNATRQASPAQMSALDECNILDFFLQYFNKNDDSQNIKIALEGIANTLNQGASMALQENTENPENMFLTKLDDKGGIKLLEDLQQHEDHEIYQKVQKIFERHFETEDVLFADS